MKVVFFPNKWKIPGIIVQIYIICMQSYYVHHCVNLHDTFGCCKIIVTGTKWETWHCLSLSILWKGDGITFFKFDVYKLGTRQKMGERRELDDKERDIHLSSFIPELLRARKESVMNEWPLTCSFPWGHSWQDHENKRREKNEKWEIWVGKSLRPS